MFQPLNAKVESPNYKFDIERLSDFFPDKQISNLDSKFGKGEIMSHEGGVQTFKYVVKDTRYQFTVLVQAKEGLIQDFFARLPSYFLHDVFFQSLINRNGKQTTTKKTGEEAYYVWDLAPLMHIYSAACTITCFPIFYAVEKKDSQSKSILTKMKIANKI
jgi:hypothetical protein